LRVEGRVNGYASRGWSRDTKHSPVFAALRLGKAFNSDLRREQAFKSIKIEDEDENEDELGRWELV
jgi:hypothetical protein